MPGYPNELFSDTCWVYVQQDEENNYIIAITYNEGFYIEEVNAGHPILLWRKFDDTLTAAGFRIALKKLSHQSLLETLKRYNETLPKTN